MAETPRRQIGQVGETSKSIRFSFAALLNCPVNWVKLVSLRAVRLPSDGPHRYHPASKTTTITTKTSRFFVLSIVMLHPARMLAIICGKRINISTTAVAIQKIATDIRLRLGH
jgi:hypothetical protein